MIDAVVGEARAGAPAGVYVEPKGLTVTLHWRHAPEARGWVEAFVARAAAEHGLALHPGRMELELRPPVAGGQGDRGAPAGGERAGRLRQVAVFGDDLGDLPAFEAVGRLGTPAAPVGAVRVAAVDDESPAAVAERADLAVPGAAGAVALLRDLAGAAAGAPALGERAAAAS